MSYPFTPTPDPYSTFTNISSKRIGSTPFNIPEVNPGETFTVPTKYVTAAHIALVQAGVLSVTPDLPSGLDQDVQDFSPVLHDAIQLRAWLTSRNTQVKFPADATPVHATEVTVAVMVQDAGNITNLLENQQEVQLDVDVGTITYVDPAVLISQPLPTRAIVKFRDGIATIKVTKATAGAQTLSASNPVPTLTVTDVMVLTYS